MQFPLFQFSFFAYRCTKTESIACRSIRSTQALGSIQNRVLCTLYRIFFFTYLSLPFFCFVIFCFSLSSYFRFPTFIFILYFAFFIVVKTTTWLMVFCIVFAGNNYLNDNHDHNLIKHGNNIDTARNVNTNTINSNAISNYRGGHDSNDAQQHQTPFQRPPCAAEGGVNLTSTSNAIPSLLGNTASNSPIPTTIDGLIEYIARNGDQYEEKIISEITKMNERTLFR